MKSAMILVVFILTLGLVALDADARRFGGGGSFGRQRPAPTMRETQPTPPPAAPAAAKPAQGATAPAQGTAATAGAAAKPGFMGRWGGLLAGLGIGALLAGLFGEQLGPIIGLMLAAMLGFGLLYLVYRLFAARGSAAAPGGRPAQFAGIGSRISGVNGDSGASATAAASRHPAYARPAVPAGFDAEAFLRVAKTSFIRLQAANDAADLDDIRDYTTPEVYAELAIQIEERQGAAQKTEVVSLEARLVEVAQEDGYEIASVRFYGLVRETPGANPEPFDETWHVRKKMNDRRATWLICGIQQNDA